MKILVAPNSFKGSLSATTAAECIIRGMQRAGLNAEFITIPLADGGDGTLDAFLAGGGQRITVDTYDALMRPIRADYAKLADGETAVVEMAQASGLAVLKPEEIDPESALKASTYGTGVLMQAALEHGARRIIVGLGGSATTDGGTGCLQALGVKFLNASGAELPPGGGALQRLDRIDRSGIDPRWQEVEIIIATDVENIALGEQGAAHIFGPQKGAGPDEVEQLAAGLAHLFDMISQQFSVDVREIPGGGAAGAFAAGLMAFFDAHIEPGIDIILNNFDFEEQLRGASLVITGEGQIDTQTLGGKGPIGLARRASAAGVPTAAIVGRVGADDALLHDGGIAAVLPIVNGPMSLSDALAEAETLLEAAALRLAYCLLLGQRLR